MNPEEKNNKFPLSEAQKSNKSLRTYQGDVEETILKNNYSSKDIFLAEEQKKRLYSEKFPMLGDSNLKNKFLGILAVIIFILGIGVMGFVYYLKSNEEIVLQQKTKAIIGYSEEKLLSISTTTREKFINQLLDEKTSLNLPVNSVLYINTVDGSNTTARTEDLILLLAPQMPNSLSRSFSQKYMIGIFSFDTNEPFIILKTDDFALSFAGMLKWEKYMESDLGKLFGVIHNASSTPATFVDQERRNKDLRVLKDEKGKILFLYSFIDTNTILITKNENVFTAILSKYLISKQDK